MSYFSALTLTHTVSLPVPVCHFLCFCLSVPSPRKLSQLSSLFQPQCSWHAQPQIVHFICCCSYHTPLQCLAYCFSTDDFKYFSTLLFLCTFCGNYFDNLLRGYQSLRNTNTDTLHTCLWILYVRVCLNRWKLKSFSKMLIYISILHTHIRTHIYTTPIHTFTYHLYHL